LALPGRAESGAPASKSMAEKLAELRTQVNDLDAALRNRRSENANSLRSLATRLGELKAMEDAERLKQKGLEAELGEIQTRATERDALLTTLRSAVLEAISKIEKPVRAGLPFKVDDRLAALSRIREDLERGKSDPSDSATMLWRFVEDEQRLASTVEQAEVAMVLDTNGPPTLVRVIRVGLVALYVHRPDGGFGRVVRGGDGSFAYSPVTDSRQSTEIGRLFSATEKQVREGRYRLPLLGKGVRLR
jgi:hypothetical protein